MVNKVQLKQIYCSYSRIHNIQNVFLHSLLVFWGQHCCWTETSILVKNLLFFYKYAFPSILLLTPALPLLRLLPAFYVISPINWASPQTWLSKFRSQNC